MPFVRTRDNIPIHYHMYGNGPVTLLFIHPPGMGLVTFKQQIDLSKKFTILLVDLRGNGKSGLDSKQISFSLLAQDLADVLDGLKIDKAVLCGYSNGGSIALEFSYNYPSRTAGLILVGAFPKVNSILLFAEFMLGIVATKLNGISLIAKVIGNAHAHSKQFGRELEQYIKKTKASTLHQMYNEGVKYDCTSKLSSIDVPILLVYGQKDYYVHHYQKEFKALHHDTDVVYVSKAKHQVPTKFAKEFNAICVSFIENKLMKKGD